MRYYLGMTNIQLTPAELATRETIAANLDAELSRKRYTKRRAALAMGLSHVYVTRRAKGQVELSGSDMVMFAKFLNIPVTRFFVGLPDLDSNQEPAGYTLDHSAHTRIHSQNHSANVLHFRPRASGNP